MLNARIFIFLAALALFGSSVFAQTAPKSTQMMPLSEVKEGMRGTAMTVFRGSEAEEFNVEILGVLPGGVGPKQDLIVGRLSGGGTDRTGVFAGMSGSPVYINGKLVGAISYSFPFSKEPICGITPIEQMISIFEHNNNTKRKASEPRSVSFAELASTTWMPSLPGRPALTGTASASAQSAMASISGQSFRPIATPVTFSGFSQQTLDAFAPQLLQAGLLPVAGAGGAAKMSSLKKADATTLVGGDSVSMQLTRGDYSMAASGTVTFRDGEKVYAFGHPFLSLGTADLPMSESSVVTVIPNVNNSFKLAVADSMVGSMTQDRATGVFGSLGQAPKMIPVTLNLETSRGQTETLKFEVANDEFLTPLLLNIAVYNSIVANERSLGDSTVEMTGKIAVKGQEPITLQRRFTGAQASQWAAASVAIPVSTLLRSRFDGLEIGEVVLNVNSIDGSKTAVLERIAVDRTQVKPGETVEVQAFVRSESGKVFVHKVPVTIPADTPAGALSITIGDGNVVQQSAAIQQFVPKNVSELIDTINKAKMPDRLYAQAVRVTTGAIIGANELPNLPPSMLATLNSDRTAGGVKSSTQTVIVEKEIPPADFIITGQQSLAIQVIK